MEKFCIVSTFMMVIMKGFHKFKQTVLTCIADYCRTSNISLHQIFTRKNKFAKITCRENGWSIFSPFQ